jgi:hypothetical protein
MEKILNSTPGRCPNGVPRHPSVPISFVVHCDITIVDLIPQTMDYGDESLDDLTAPLWQHIPSLPDIYHVDSCHRIPDLGKRNVSCLASSNHSRTAKWIGHHMVAHWKDIMIDLIPIVTFPVLEHLSRSRPSCSVASGLTNASPVSHYLKSPRSNHPVPTTTQHVTHNPWRLGPRYSVQLCSHQGLPRSLCHGQYHYYHVGDHDSFAFCHLRCYRISFL